MAVGPEACIAGIRRMGAREAAVCALLAVLDEGRTLDDALAAVMPALGDRRDRSLAQELCYGTLRRLEQLQRLSERLLAKPLKRRDRDVALLIMLGLHQLMYTRIPPHAAVAETVEVARSRGKPWAAGLLNAVLRTFQRQKPEVLSSASVLSEVGWALPGWLRAELENAWPEHWQSIALAMSERPPMSLRVNLRRIDRDSFVERCAEIGLSGRPISFTSGGVELAEAYDVSQLPGFEEGWVSVQDGAAQLAAGVLAPAPGQRVLDACAAPGGKTCQILETAPKDVRVTAIDSDVGRVERILENLLRLGLEAEVAVGDATDPGRSPWAQRAYQRILLDVPCSATGVIRRHPDIKLLRRPGDIVRMAERQARMLEAMWPLLARGGRLLYVTCSVLPAENEHQILAFLGRHIDSRELPIEAPWGWPREVGRQVLPGDNGMDGFYFACLEKQ